MRNIESKRLALGLASFALVVHAPLSEYVARSRAGGSKVSSLLVACALWVRLTLRTACSVLWDTYLRRTPPRPARFRHASTPLIPVSAQGKIIRPRMKREDLDAYVRKL